MSSMVTPAFESSPVSRLLLRPARKQLRHRRTGLPGPGRPHRGDPAADPAVRMAAPRVFPLRPVAPAVQRSGMPEPALRLRLENLPPVRLQRQRPHAATDARTPPGGQAGTSLPARRPVTRPGVVRTHERVGEDGADPVEGLPVVRHALRRQPQRQGGEAVDPHGRSDQEAVVVKDEAHVRDPRPRRPADGTVPRPQLAGRRNEAQTAEPPLRAAHDPVPQLPSRSPPPALRMVRLHHRLPGAAVRLRQRLQPDPAERVQSALDRGAARVVGGRSPVGRREARRRLRQRQAELLREQGKDPHPGDRRRPPVVGQPPSPAAQLAGEARTRDAAAEAFVPEPLDRGRGNLSETNIHGPRFAWIRSLVKYAVVTGSGAGEWRPCT